MIVQNPRITLLLNMLHIRDPRIHQIQIHYNPEKEKRFYFVFLDEDSNELFLDNKQQELFLFQSDFEGILRVFGVNFSSKPYMGGDWEITLDAEHYIQVKKMCFYLPTCDLQMIIPQEMEPSKEVTRHFDEQASQNMRLLWKVVENESHS